MDNGIVLAIITFNFWFGGAVSYFAAIRFLKHTLLLNAVFFWIIGLGIIFFLVSLGLSVNAAVSGNWKWHKTTQSLRMASDKNHAGISLIDMFDAIDKNQNGEVSPEDLLNALLQAGVKTNLRTVRILVCYAAANKNGTIDREEWATIVERVMEGEAFTAGSSVAKRISRSAEEMEEEAADEDCAAQHA